jgi:hypothetical protein
MFAAHTVAAFSLPVLKASNFEYKPQLTPDLPLKYSGFLEIALVNRRYGGDVVGILSKISRRPQNKLLRCKRRLDAISL